MELIQQLSLLREHNDHVEFKRAKHDFPFTGGQKTDIRERRKCVLGYIVALANERGGRLVLGMEDKYPHEVSGTDFGLNRIGQIEDEVYKKLGIRIKIHEHYDSQGLRVVVFDVPSRPIAKVLKFEGIPLMRVGESLREMDDAEYFHIISEADPDFSAKCSPSITLDDLDPTAICEMRRLLALKKTNPDYYTIDTMQLLSDLALYTKDGFTYAALLLLGKEEAIKRLLPQCNVVVEYRLDHSMTRYTARREFRGPFFLIINEIWDYINQAASNPLLHIDRLPQIVNIPAFNKEAIREAIINAMIHRSLQMNGDILIRQYPDSILISNPGGFPFGVNMGNILTVNSSPRSRRMAEVIEKTGLIERSGQGVDIIYATCIREGKSLPDYSMSDDFQVELSLEGVIRYPLLYCYISDFESSKEPSQHLNVFDLLTLYNVMRGEVEMVYPQSIKRLENLGLIKLHDYFKYVMGDNYFGALPIVNGSEESRAMASKLFYLLKAKTSIVMADISQAFSGNKTVKQLRTFIEKCLQSRVLLKNGNLKSTRYTAGPVLAPYLAEQTGNP